MRRVLCNLFVCLAVSCSMVSAQTAQPAKPVAKAPAKANPNDDIIKLTMAGMGEDIILGVVAKTDKSTYDTSVDALLKLKSAGVSPKVIAAILGVGTATPSAPVLSYPQVPVQHVGVSLESPSTKSVEGREAGIYLVSGTRMDQLEPAVYSGGKTGNKLGNAITTLIPKTDKAVVRSARANQRLQTSTPEFQFYFENRGAGLGNTGGMFTGFMNGASSPNEFVLVRMKVSTDEREVVIGRSWTFSDRTGVQSKDTIDFISERIRPGVYKVTPRTPLTAGEYCFFYAAGLQATAQMGVGKLFDFGVDAGATAK